MGRRQVYVQDSDAPLWELLEQVAGRQGVSVSKLLARIIRDYLGVEDAERP